MVLRLIPCSPRRANSCGHRRWRIKAHQTRSDLMSPPPAWHQQRVSEPHGFAVRKKRRSTCAPSIAHEVHLALRPTIAPDAVASTASRPALVTTRDRPSVGRDGDGYRFDLGQRRSEIFFAEGLDTGQPENRTDLPVGQIRAPAGWVEPSANPITRRSEHDGHRFRLRSSSYGGQVAQPILRAGNRGEADWAKV